MRITAHYLTTSGGIIHSSSVTSVQTQTCRQTGSKAHAGWSVASSTIMPVCVDLSAKGIPRLFEGSSLAG